MRVRKDGNTLTDLPESELAKEILAYDGTVEMYLTERSRKLRVPERVLF